MIILCLRARLIPYLSLSLLSPPHLPHAVGAHSRAFSLMPFPSPSPSCSLSGWGLWGEPEVGFGLVGRREAASSFHPRPFLPPRPPSASSRGWTGLGQLRAIAMAIAGGDPRIKHGRTTPSLSLYLSVARLPESPGQAS